MSKVIRLSDETQQLLEEYKQIIDKKVDDKYMKDYYLSKEDLVIGHAIRSAIFWEDFDFQQKNITE